MYSRGRLLFFGSANLGIEDEIDSEFIFSLRADLPIDSGYLRCLNYICSPKFVPSMAKKNNKNEALIKFVAPDELKNALQELANERNISLSSLLRLIATEYVKRNRLS
jgi:hypothetical protein